MASPGAPAEASKVEGVISAEENVQNQPLESEKVQSESSAPVGAQNSSEDQAVPKSVSSPVEGLVSDVDGQNGSTGANGDVAEGSKPSAKTLEEADAFFDKGCIALKENDIIQAVDSLSRALEIRVAHFGELAPECATSYFKYGCALLYKAQDEADPLNASVALAKKAQTASKNAADGATGKNGETESPKGLASEMPVPSVTDAKEKAPASDNNGKEPITDENNDGEEESEGEESDDEDAGEACGEEVDDEEESDLDLAWKNLEAARVILDKQEDTIEKVDVISALGDVSLEREDFSTSADDYLRALSILEKMDEAQSRHIAELCFKICLALQMENKIPEALSYCQRALSICTSCMQTLTDKVETSKLEMASKDAQTSNGSAGIQNNVEPIESKEEDIKMFKGLMADLSEKVEDLKQMMTEPPLSEAMRFINDKIDAEDKFQFALSGGSSKEANVSTGFDQPTLANGPSNGTVTHLGVVGRGVKRAAPVPIDAFQPTPKRLSSDHTPTERTDRSAMEASEATCQNSEGQAD
ncbi:hypothetical protein SUGI_0609190 [Cryptomeria japonica]|uniref:uncharacterized protein LOC131071461 n=1 Tax=Cryptomeria japonica TaxID=3369 RepID=UPI002414BB2E|nr:uncharacterized protein LOC131071461 [Cryptomeria japonica]XP_059063307.1 uncharacterized protein LOC131071461 [Cryptomeria japonica]GLJ30740.1 hypothetical protein SUGI_0609190 [Cryptomeria japonica]